MRLNATLRDVDTLHANPTSRFKIKANAKAFEILSSRLYKDKVLAVVRETCTNAYDAHLSAGIGDRPIEVYLPNDIVPVFRVRDFGKGLSRDDVENIYTTYFHSTKEESDDEMGCLGLGTKAPFSLTDTFQVISRFGGERMTFDMFKDKMGEPQCVMRSCVPMDSDEETGLEVMVASGMRNKAFHDAAKKALVFFEPRPRVVGAGHDHEFFPSKTPIIKGDGWANYPDSERNGKAIMGVIGYPVNCYSAEGLSKFSNLVSALTVRFPMGALDITAGREELSYDERTVENLKKRYSEIDQEIKDRISARIKKCSSLIEAMQIRNDNRRLVQGWDVEKLHWNGKEIPTTLVLPSRPKVGPTFWKPDTTLTRNLLRGRLTAFSTRMPLDSVIYFSGEVSHVEAKRRIRYHANDGVFHIECPPEVEKILRLLWDGMDFRKASDLEKPPVRRASKAITTVKARTPSGTLVHQELPPHTEKGHWYVISDRGQYDTQSYAFLSMSNEQKLRIESEFDVIIPETIYIVPRSKLGKKREENWIDANKIMGAVKRKYDDKQAMYLYVRANQYWVRSLPKTHWLLERLDMLNVGLPTRDGRAEKRFADLAFKRYPLLQYINEAPTAKIIEYIRMIDKEAGFSTEEPKGEAHA